MRRRWWTLRIRFHDWMWDGGAKPDLLRRVSRRLPWYFSDPWAGTRRQRRNARHEINKETP